MSKRRTVGSISLDLLKKDPDTRDPIELQREMQQDYIDNLITCVQTHRKNHKGSFFVVVIAKKEPLMQNVMRNYFFARISCPTPDYDQAVYRYDCQKEELEYLWCIPDRETCYMFLENKKEIVPEEQDLLQHIIDFSDGTLYHLSKKLNNEKIDSIYIEE